MSWIISTDMDGTLLNHDDYRWDAAKPCLEVLNKEQIPVILNTSKTLDEVESWIKEIALMQPFIVENGSAIYCPDGYIEHQIVTNANYPVTYQDGYQIIQLGQPIAELLHFKKQFMPEIESLVECDVTRAIELTGLSETEAIAARNRAYTLPLVIQSNAVLDRVTSQARSHGMQILSGGRFAHLMGDTDKGRAIRIFVQLYQQQHQCDCKLIALGDSDNDRAMLAVADHVIVVRNYQGKWLSVEGDRVYQTTQQAPEGWTEGITSVLSSHYKSIQELLNG